MSKARVISNVIGVMIVPGSVVVVPRVHWTQVHSGSIQRLHYEAGAINTDTRGTRIIPYVRSCAHVFDCRGNHRVNAVIPRRVVWNLGNRAVSENTLPQMRNANGFVRDLVVGCRVLIANVFLLIRRCLKCETLSNRSVTFIDLQICTIGNMSTTDIENVTRIQSGGNYPPPTFVLDYPSLGTTPIRFPLLHIST